jgi:hypothetical protein
MTAGVHWGLGGAAVASPLAARAEQGERVRRVGILKVGRKWQRFARGSRSMVGSRADD